LPPFFLLKFDAMTCLESLVGLKGGCASIASNASMYLNTKVTYNELSSYVDQNDYPSVDDFFIAMRAQAVRELIDGIQERMRDGFIARTVVTTKNVGYQQNPLTASAAIAKYKGVKLTRNYPLPSLAYRVTRVAFTGSFTGNVPVLFIDGLTGQTIDTVTIAAVAGEEVSTYVNTLYRVETLLAVFDATTVGGYKTTVGHGTQVCFTCPTSCSVNSYVTGQAITTPVGTPLTQTNVNEMGGLTISVAMECDSEGWLCQIKNQLTLPILFRTASLIMEYAIFNTSRGDTNTIRDLEKLKERHTMYASSFDSGMTRALETIVLPNDPTCFHCKKQLQIITTLP